MLVAVKFFLERSMMLVDDEDDLEGMCMVVWIDWKRCRIECRL